MEHIFTYMWIADSADNIAQDCRFGLYYAFSRKRYRFCIYWLFCFVLGICMDRGALYFEIH